MSRMLMYDEDTNTIVAAGETSGYCKIKNFPKIVTNPSKYQGIERSADKYTDEIREGRGYIFKCKDCGEYILITESEAKWYTDHEYAVPKRCRDCRQKRKEQSQATEKKEEVVAEKE